MSFRIAETPVQDRPRERLLSLGAAALTTAELLAILIGTGRSGASAPEVSAALLAQRGPDLPRLARRTVAELASVAGIGSAKASRVAAALELGRRLLEDGRPDRPWEVVVDHLGSVGPPGVALRPCLADVDQPSRTAGR